jgi:hypothetical protein
MEELTLKVTREEFNVMMNALSVRPLAEVNNLFYKLIRQAQDQTEQVIGPPPTDTAVGSE